MSYKALLVYVDGVAQSEACVRFTFHLAEKFGATVIGLTAGLPRPVIDPYSGAVAGIAYETEEEMIEADFKSAEAMFHAVAASASVPSEWRAVHDFPGKAVLDSAAAADLIVLAQGGAGGGAGVFTTAAPSEILMGAGRPVLFMPPDVAPSEINDVLVAWKDTREARRALSDALPFLRIAEGTVVLEVGSEETAADIADGLANVRAYLKRHGIEARAEHVPLDDRNAAEQLLRFASQASTDLIVAGGYGHSRLREWMLGGVTKELLGESPVPVLLSH